MANYVSNQHEMSPRDRDGNLISIGKTVYLSAGWDKDNKPLPYEQGLVVGISYVNGKHYLLLEGCSMQQVGVHLVHSSDPYHIPDVGKMVKDHIGDSNEMVSPND